MADQYVFNQKRIIRKRLNRIWPGVITVFLLVSLVFGVLLWAFLPVPSSWKTEEITITEIRHRSKPRGFVRYAAEGYELTDSDGNLYWLGGELTWPREGQRYTVTYGEKLIYRYMKGVTQNGEILRSLDDYRAAWERDSRFLLPMLALCLAAYVKLFLHLYRELHHPEILACKKRIAAHEARLRRRALDQRSK